MRVPLLLLRDVLVEKAGPHLTEGHIPEPHAVARAWWLRLLIARQRPESVLDALRQAATLSPDEAATLADELVSERPTHSPLINDSLTRALAHMSSLVRRALQLAGDRQATPSCDGDLLPFVPRRVPTLLPGVRLVGASDFLVGEYRGGGGFAELYEACNPILPHAPRVGMKISFIDKGRRYLTHEAYSNNRMRRDGCRRLLPVRDTFLDAEFPAITYPLVDGFNLRELLDARFRTGRLPDPWWVAELSRRVSLALADLHAHGHAHRDVKPGNIMIGRVDGGPRDIHLIDVGISGPILGWVDDGPYGEDTRRGINRLLVYSHSPIYAPSERLHYRYDPGYTRAIDDVYAAGVVAIQALTGVFDRRVDRFDWQSILAGRRVPPLLTAVLADCVSVNPRRRPPDGGALAERLGEVVRAAAWRRN